MIFTAKRAVQDVMPRLAHGNQMKHGAARMECKGEGRANEETITHDRFELARVTRAKGSECSEDTRSCIEVAA